MDLVFSSVKTQCRVHFVAVGLQTTLKFVLGAFLGMIWSFTRIFVPSGSGRQRYSVLGAVETRDHDFVSIRTAGSINAEVVCELLEKISATYPGEEITLVMDNARYQRSRLVMEMADALDEFLDSLNGKNREHLKTLVTENFQILQNPKI